MNFNQKINEVTQVIKNQFGENSIHSVVVCKSHGISLKEINLVKVSCEIKDENITNRSFPKLISHASSVVKKMQLERKDKAITNPEGDIVKGRLLSIRQRDNGNTVCMVIMENLICKDEIEKLRTATSFSIAFTAIHQTKHAGEQNRKIVALKKAKKKKQPLLATAS
jgi:hypothetical protein